MANFIVIVDPDRDRRTRFVETIEPLLPPLEGLVTNRCYSGDFYAIWAANPTAPISLDTDEQGAAVVWGDAIAPDSDRTTNAKSLRKLWRGESYSKNSVGNSESILGFFTVVEE